MRHVSLIVALALALAGCGGLSHTVDKRLLADVTIEHKLMLFDAENDVSIAVDEREQVLRRLRELRREAAEAGAQRREAESDEERAEAKNDSKRVELAVEAAAVAEKRLAYLVAEMAVERERLAAQEGLLWVALAKYELAKAKLVERNNLPGAADLELPDFEAQVDACIEDAKQLQADLTESEAQAAERLKEWLAARDALAQRSGGGVGSPWAEGSASWGGWE